MRKIITSIAYIFIVVAIFLNVLFYSLNTSNIVNKGILNKEVTTDIITDCTGEWEFYYNKLLIQDNVNISETKMDGYINISQQWTSLSTKENPISNKGYGTYRIIIDKLVEKDVVRFVKPPTSVPLTVYANRKKIASSGKVGKTKDDSKPSSTFEYIDSYLLDKTQEVEIIIEVGYNIFGGIDFVPSITTTNYKDISVELYKHIGITITIILLVLCVVEFVSFIKIYDSTIYTFNTIVTLLFLFLLTPYSNNIFASYNFFILPFIQCGLNFLFYSLFLLSMHFFLRYTYKDKMLRKEIILHFVFLLIINLIYIFLIPSNMQIIPFAILTGFYIITFFAFTYFNKPKNEFNATFYHIKLIIYFTICAELIINLQPNILNLKSNVSTSVCFFLIIITYILIYLSFLIRTYKQAINGFKIEVANQNLNLIILKNQIKPHFVFNVLNIIKALYHKDVEKGDLALDLFATHLRYNVNTCKTNLINFNDELENIYNLVELENLIKNEEINIIYNIDYIDFQVPVLSLEPFVENTIKYSMITQKEDGYIEISSYLEDDDKIIITIVDNGVGFDKKAIKETSNGINNTIERFKILLSAKVEIDAEPNKGVQVKITIPRGDKNENNHS